MLVKKERRKGEKEFRKTEKKTFEDKVFPALKRNVKSLLENE